MGANFRSLQPLKKHRIYRPYIPNMKTPAIFIMVKDVINYFKDIYVNLTMNL